MKSNLPNDTSPFSFEEVVPEPEIKWRETLRVFCQNRMALLGLILVTVFVFVGLFGSFIFPADPFEMVATPLSEPGAGVMFGSDYMGRDVFIGIIYGTQPTLVIATIATLVTVLIGITLGAVAGFYGGIIDNILMLSLIHI